MAKDTQPAGAPLLRVGDPVDYFTAAAPGGRISSEAFAGIVAYVENPRQVNVAYFSKLGQALMNQAVPVYFEGEPLPSGTFCCPRGTRVPAKNTGEIARVRPEPPKDVPAEPAPATKRRA